jgi:hypothetical protein
MPPRPPAGSSRPTIRKYYTSNQDAALATFLATRNRQDHFDNAGSEQQIAERVDEPDARRVRRRTEGSDIHVRSLLILSVCVLNQLELLRTLLKIPITNLKITALPPITHSIILRVLAPTIDK